MISLASSDDPVASGLTFSSPGGSCHSGATQSSSILATRRQQASLAARTGSPQDALHNANPAHWLPACCAHALHNFSEEHLSVLANPDTLASFNAEVVDPLLRSETSKAKNICKACFLLPTQALLLFSDAALYQSLMASWRRLYHQSPHCLPKIHSPLYWPCLPQNCGWLRFSQALIFLNPPLVGCACKPSKATTAVTYPATLIPLPKTWSPPTNSPSSPKAPSSLCSRTFWKPSSS